MQPKFGGVQLLTRHAYFDGPIPDSAWTSALNLVRATASNLRATDMAVFIDRPGEHDIELIGPKVLRSALAPEFLPCQRTATATYAATT